MHDYKPPYQRAECFMALINGARQTMGVDQLDPNAKAALSEPLRSYCDLHSPLCQEDDKIANEWQKI